jgi:hypothetical protein
MKEDLAMRAAGEGDSLQHILKQLTQSYIVCRECFSEGNYPTILKPHDFERSSLESILSASEFGLNTIYEKNEDDELEMKEWTLDDKQRLIDAVTQFGPDFEQVSKYLESFFTPYECALQFISLPISESLMSRL